MRVTPEQLHLIKTLGHRYFGDDAEFWLFGSRADDSKRGGDYDFLIETALNDAEIIVTRKIDLIAELQNTVPFEDEKIDIVVKRRFSSFDMPIYAIAKQEGVRL
ncbi:MAG: hypothetical protein ACYC0M_05125 [Burkholderiales bacterium]